MGGGHLHPERLSTPRYRPLGHSGQPFCLSKAFPSAVKTPQVSSICTRNSSWTPRSPISRTTQPLTLCPAPAELLPQLLEPPVRPHTPWQLPPGTATARGFGDTMLTLTCCILRLVSSLPMLPLAASAQESYTHVPFTAPVSFSPGNPRRLLCLFLSLSHIPSLSHMGPSTMPFSSTSLTQPGFFLTSDLRTLLGKRFLDNILRLRPYHHQPQRCP